jgi:hypothetical protein
MAERSRETRVLRNSVRISALFYMSSQACSQACYRADRCRREPLKGEDLMMTRCAATIQAVGRHSLSSFLPVC